MKQICDFVMLSPFPIITSRQHRKTFLYSQYTQSEYTEVQNFQKDENSKTYEVTVIKEYYGLQYQIGNLIDHNEGKVKLEKGLVQTYEWASAEDVEEIGRPFIL